MRFTIRHLLLLFPSCLLALSVASVFDHVVNQSCCVLSLPAGAWTQVVQTRGLLRLLPSDWKSPPDEASVNFWLSGKLPANDPLARELGHAPQPDPWGNPLVYVTLHERRDGDDGESAIGVYSLGADGISKTAGNDPDDLNSWDERCIDFYSARYAAWRAAELRKRLVVWGVILTPVAYGLLYSLGRLWNYVVYEPVNRNLSKPFKR